MKKNAAIFVFAIIVGIAGWAAYFWLAVDYPLKKALGLKRWPASIQNLHVKVDYLLGFRVSTYFEVSAEDFDELVKCRKYTKVKDDYLGKAPLSNPFPISHPVQLAKAFPELAENTFSDGYLWTDEIEEVKCIMSVNSTKTKVFARYTKEF